MCEEGQGDVEEEDDEVEFEDKQNELQVDRYLGLCNADMDVCEEEDGSLQDEVTPETDECDELEEDDRTDG